MKRLVALLLSLCAAHACSFEARQSNPYGNVKAPQSGYFLAQSFRVDDARCEVSEAKERVSESARAATQRRVSPDVRVLEITIDCVAHDGTKLRTNEVLPKDLVILLRDAKGTLHAPSTRTWVSKREPEHFVFELEDGTFALPRPRRFDVTTGRRKLVETAKPAELWLSATDLSVSVALRYIFEDAAFEASLDALSGALRNGEAEQTRGFSELSALHRSILETTGAQVLTITPLASSGEAPVVSLAYSGFARTFPWQIPDVLLELERRPDEQPKYKLKATRDALDVRRGLRCAERSRELEAQAQRAYESASGETECNVLGLLWPVACQEVPSAVIERATIVRADCAMPPLSTLASPAATLPEDFQLTLRRGRAGGPLDRTPRYVVALFSNGAIAFHGQHWVGSLGRSDGRTSPRFLSALLRHVEGISFFDRKGGQWKEDGCDPSADDGHVITIHAHHRERMVLDRDGCRGPFSKAELTQLIALIEQVSFVDAFTAQRPDYADRRAKVWTIADDSLDHGEF